MVLQRSCPRRRWLPHLPPAALRVAPRWNAMPHVASSTKLDGLLRSALCTRAREDDTTSSCAAYTSERRDGAVRRGSWQAVGAHSLEPWQHAIRKVGECSTAHCAHLMHSSRLAGTFSPAHVRVSRRLLYRHTRHHARSVPGTSHYSSAGAPWSTGTHKIRRRRSDRSGRHLTELRMQQATIQYDVP